MSQNSGSKTWKFITGQPLGEARTDASAFRRATRITHQSGRASQWAHHSHARRAAVRLGALAGTAGSIAGYLTHPLATEMTAGSLAAGAVAESSRRTARAVKRRQHYKEWVRPLHKALSTSPALIPVGIAPGVRPETYLTVPVDYATNEDAEILMRLPEGFAGGVLKHEIERIIREKLGMSEIIATWRTAGHEPYVSIRIAPLPPKRIKWSDALDLIEDAPESAPIIGLAARNIPVSIDLDSEAPHVLISASSGGGKSVMVRVIACQLMRRGAHLIVLDAKRHSHRWARDLENVTYCRSNEEIHDALVWAAQEGERRNLLVDEKGEEAVAELPRIVIIAEEMNATITRLQRYWDATREKSDPKRSPAIEALGEILFMGRAVRENVIAVAQMMTARTLGGPEARENFAVRILARYTRNSWMMLVPEIQPMPRSSRHSGRVQVCIAGQATETQVLFPSEDEAREWAAMGAESDAPAVAGPFTVPTSQRVATGSVQGNEGSSVSDTPHLTLVPDLPPELSGVTLSEAVRDGVLTCSLDSARKESNRDPEFPKPIDRRGKAKVYDPADLMRWQRNRPRAAG